MDDKWQPCTDYFQVSTLSGLSSCLCHLPDNIIDQIFAADCEGEDSIYRGTFVRCYLVGNGLQPIALLNSCIDAAFNNDNWYERFYNYFLTPKSFQNGFILIGKNFLL